MEIPLKIIIDSDDLPDKLFRSIVNETIERMDVGLHPTNGKILLWWGGLSKSRKMRSVNLLKLFKEHEDMFREQNKADINRWIKVLETCIEMLKNKRIEGR